MTKNLVAMFSMVCHKQPFLNICFFWCVMNKLFSRYVASMIAVPHMFLGRRLHDVFSIDHCYILLFDDK